MRETSKKEIRNVIEAAYHNTDLKLEEITGIMQKVQLLYDIEKIFVVTNSEYKYQLSHLLTCTVERVEYRKPVTFTLTRQEYLDRLRMYQKEGTTQKQFQKVERDGFMLHAGLVREDEFFGAIAYWSEHERIWTEEEKNILIELSHLCLLFISMNNMVHGSNHYKRAFEEFQNDRIVAGFFVNVMTREIRAMKLPEGMKHVFPEWGDYDKLLKVYSDNYVEGLYRKKFLEEAGYAAVRKHLTKATPILTTEFPRVFDGKLNWIRYQAQGYNFLEDGTPTVAISAFFDITEEMKDRVYLFGASEIRENSYTTIISLDLNTEQYAVCVDNRREDSKTDSFAFFGDYQQIRDEIHPDIITEEQERQLEKMFDVPYLIEYFDQNEESLQSDFSCVLNDMSFWVRFQTIKGSDYRSDNRVVMMYLSDVTEEKNRQLSLEEYQKELERENQKKKYQLEHDSLTGVYNRFGYNEVLQEMQDDRRPMAYMQIDVDNFKNINDTYGHDVGDEVLKTVASLLSETFRSDDYVFRFGGDEFAVLLTNCKPANWEKIGEKLQRIHLQMNQILKKGIYMTLSMGVCWSETGFSKDIISLADAALYQVKSKGRAGCCIFDDAGQSLYEWKDEIEDSAGVNALEQSDTGACRIELPAGDLARGRLICNETARSIMGFDASMTPEDCFVTWLKRVDSYDREMLTKTYQAMMEKGQAECSYLYHHPVHGQKMVRSGGKCLKNEEGLIFYGYHQSLPETRIVLHEDDSQKLIDAMTALYFASYYINLLEDWYCIFKSTMESRQLEKQEVPASVAIHQFVETLVKPEYREKMHAFVDLETLPERLQDRQYVEAEYQSMVEDKGWCRVRLLAVRRDEGGTVTHIQFLVASIDKEKKKKLEAEKAERHALQLQLRAGEIIAKSKIRHIGLMDRKTGTMQLYMQGLVKKDAVSYPFWMMKEWALEHAYDLEYPLLEKKFNPEYIENEIQKDGSCTMAFREVEENGEVSLLIHHYEVYETDPTKLLVVIEDVTNSMPQGVGRIQELYVLENLAESLALFDYETYEVIYLNKAARDGLGIDPLGYKNEKCYHLFCGREEPCEFCDKIILDRGELGYMHRKIEATGTYAHLYGRAVEINGRKYRLEQAIPDDALRK